MNLHEQTNRIKQMMGINESNFFKRRLNSKEINKEFNYSLDYATNMFNHTLDINGVSEEDFKRMVIHILMDGFHPKLSNGGVNNFPYNEIQDFLLNQYESKIVDRYNKIVNDKSTRS